MEGVKRILNFFRSEGESAGQPDAGLTKIFRIYYMSLSIIGVCISIYQVFHLTVAGFVLWPRAYYSLLIFCFLPLTFISVRHRKGVVGIPWFDFLAVILVQVASLYFFILTEDIEYGGWEVKAPWIPTLLGFCLCLASIEAGRRSGGNVFAIVCFVFSLFPLVAESMPGFLQGKNFAFWRIVSSYVFGTEGLYGIPMRVVGDLLIGYLIFATALQYTGGGKFFLDLAGSLLGRTRGGPAKIAVVASGFFGSMSGSAVANVCTTGAFTIPAMKKIGYPAHYAGAVEACASTGGCLMPPVMGAVAFVMANFMGVSYATVAVAAVIPSLLYYFSLLFQVDAYAARKGMRGLPRELCPPLSQTLREGWPYLFSFGFLIWGLLYMKWDATTPFYATALVLITTMIRKETRMNIPTFLKFLESIGRTLAEITAIILLVGFIIASLSMTGVANAFPNEMISLTGGSWPLLLLFGGVCSFILGMGMTVTACYVFLAVVLAPALISCGFNPMSAHMFVMYCGVLSYITPPVAIAAFAAAGIAGSPPMKVGLTAVRLGVILFIIPFAFVLSPALVFEAPLSQVFYHFITLLIGVFMLAEGFEGYFLGVGNLSVWSRLIVLIGGFALLVPLWQLKASGVILVAIWMGLKFFMRRTPTVPITK